MDALSNPGIKKENYLTAVPALTEPFGYIGLAFSGGGFRAASFSLGVLSYLHQVDFDGKKLLDRVTYMSSASGGSIATIMYALNKADGGTFKDFYKRLSEQLNGTDLLETALKILNNGAEWKNRPHKRRNLINAFAIAYDKKLFDGKSLRVLIKPENESHLEEVCFNTTDFYRGLLFRQAVKLKPDTADDITFLYGNYIAHLKKGTNDNLKLGDVLAASSCFPAGFEPIIFPDDFEVEGNKRQLLDGLCIEPQELNLKELNLLYGEQKVQDFIKTLTPPIVIKDIIEKIKKNLTLDDSFKFGMMDGGITDNQGLESLIRANERRLQGETTFKPFDLMLVNDVGSHFMDPYELPDGNKTYKGFSALSVSTYMIASVVLAVLSIAGLYTHFMYGANNPLWSGIVNTGYKFLFLFSVLFLAGIISLKKFIGGKLKGGKGLNLNKNFSPDIVKTMFSYFGSAQMGLLIRMVKERAVSVLALNSDVFLKRIRQLLYQRFFEAERWNYRVKSNHVYDLCFTNDSNYLQNGSPRLQPGAAIQVVAQKAFEMATTLWFDENNSEDSKNINAKHTEAALIACGQFTTCYNLIDYIDSLKDGEKKEKEQAETELGYVNKLKIEKATWDKIDELRKKLEDDYAEFQKNPFWLYNKLGEEYKVNNWVKQVLPEKPEVPAEFKGLRSILLRTPFS